MGFAGTWFWLYAEIQHKRIYVNTNKAFEITRLFQIQQPISIQLGWSVGNNTSKAEDTTTTRTFSAICHWVVEAEIQYAVVENDRFFWMITCCYSDIHIPCRTPLSRYIVKMKSTYEL